MNDEGGSTYYCSTECQKSDWVKHKDRCSVLQKRKALHRASKVIQDLYLVVRRDYGRNAIKKLDWVDKETLIVHLLGRDGTGENSKIAKGSDAVALSPREESIALVYNSCNTAMYTMGKSLGIILKGE